MIKLGLAQKNRGHILIIQSQTKGFFKRTSPPHFLIRKRISNIAFRSFEKKIDAGN